MTLSEIRSLLVSVDPDIRHYFSMSDADAYTYWEETRRLPLIADDRYGAEDQGWHFYVHRFTRTEGDTIAQNFFNTLDADPRTTVIWQTDYEHDTGYIHHIFECEGY